MKLQYEELQIELVALETKDVLAAISGFGGSDHDFGDPNESTPPQFSGN